MVSFRQPPQIVAINTGLLPHLSDNFRSEKGFSRQDRYLSQSEENLPSCALSFLVKMFYRNHPPDLVSFSLNFM
jgi:hypothetical protein